MENCRKLGKIIEKIKNNRIEIIGIAGIEKLIMVR